MATKKTAKQRPKQQASSLSRHKKPLILLATIAVLALVGIGYNPTLDYLDKKKFETLSESLRSLQSKLQAESGDETDWKYSVGCRGPLEHKFSTLPPSCTMFLRYSVPYISIEDSNKVIAKYDQLIIEDEDLFKVAGDKELKPLEETPGSRISNNMNERSFMTERIIEESNTSITCKVEYRAQTGDEVRFYIGCGDDARDTWYPRADAH